MVVLIKVDKYIILSFLFDFLLLVDIIVEIINVCTAMSPYRRLRLLGTWRGLSASELCREQPVQEQQLAAQSKNFQRKGRQTDEKTGEQSRNFYRVWSISK
jgi:hypothetical protein